MAAARVHTAELAAYIPGAAKTPVADRPAFSAMLQTYAWDLDSARSDNLAACRGISTL